LQEISQPRRVRGKEKPAGERNVTFDGTRSRQLGATFTPHSSSKIEFLNESKIFHLIFKET
jgi:hypothetical protein